MKSKFPDTDKLYTQTNRSNIIGYGNLWSSFNLDLQSNLGVLRISPRLIINTSTIDSASLGCPVAFKYFDTRIWAICDTRIFWNTGEPDDTPFVIDASTGNQNDYTADESDLEMFNNALCATTTDGLFSKGKAGDGTGTWTQRDILTSGTEHMMTYFKQFNRLYYLNAGTSVLSIDTNWSTADPGNDYAIDLSAPNNNNFPTCLESNTGFVWIGMMMDGQRGDPGKVYQWDGISAQVTAEYELNNAQGALAIAIDPIRDNPVVMDSNGIISEFNGAGFQEIARLPFPFSKLPYNVSDSDNERFIHPNGMYFTKNGTLRIVINNRANTGDVIENMPSGIWEYSKETGLVHVQSFTYNTLASPNTILDYGQNMISRVGAIASMNIPSSGSIDGTTLVGATIYVNATDTRNAIFFDNSSNTKQKKGYFVTNFFESEDVAESWNQWWASYRKFLDANDNMTFKYRTSEETPLVATITWVTSNTFTTTTDPTAYWTSGTGGEVEILRGDGGGSCAHITNIVNNAGTYTVTIDESLNVGDTATARFQNWTKIFPKTTLDQIIDWNVWTITTTTHPRIQLKGCFTFTGDGEFYKGIISSNVNIKSN